MSRWSAAVVQDVKLVQQQFDTLGASHQQWQLNEVNELI